jgi:hypothetical protein
VLGTAVLGTAVLGTGMLGVAVLGTGVLGTAVLGTAVLQPRARSLPTQHSFTRLSTKTSQPRGRAGLTPQGELGRVPLRVA